MANLVESLRKLLFVSPRSRVDAGAAKTATFHLMTNSGPGDGSVTLGRPYLSKERFLSARVLAKMLAISSHTINEIFTGEL
jgi:hypothetical protein